MNISPESDTLDDIEHQMLFHNMDAQQFRKERLYSMQPRQRRIEPIERELLTRKRTL